MSKLYDDGRRNDFNLENKLISIVFVYVYPDKIRHNTKPIHELVEN